MPIRHSCRKLFKVFTAPTQRGRSIVIDEFRKGTCTVTCINMSIDLFYACILGQPVAWAITDIEDAQTYQEFFKAVRVRVPDAVIDTLMTDDGEQYAIFNRLDMIFTIFSDTAIIAACSVVYPGVNHLLCRWHIDR